MLTLLALLTLALSVLQTPDSPGGRRVILTWDKGAEESPEIAYRIYRTILPGQYFDALSTVEALTFADDSVYPGYVYYYRVCSVGADESETCSAEVVADLIPPVVAITNQSDGGTIKGNVLSVTVRATDNFPGNIQRVELYLDDALCDTLTATITGLPDSNSLQVRTRSLPRGDHTLKAMAYDRAGNWAETVIRVRK